MNIQPEDLRKSGFVLLDELRHDELIPFVRKYLRKRTAVALFYTLFNVGILAFIGVWLFLNLGVNGFNWRDGLRFLSYGVALAFLFVPLHEYIHVLAYKSQGATHTSYDVYWKKFVFLAVADRFVADRKEFSVVALAPFVLISGMLILLFPWVGQSWSFTILGALLTHTAFSSGDFGLLSYFRYHRDKQVVTYDDRTNRISYFFAKAPEPPEC
jgi:hypothetical protein